MTISEIFISLNAPLNNPRWSWGAEGKKEVILRVWDESYIIINDKIYMWVSDRDEPEISNLGHSERYKHISLIRKKGLSCRMIMCTPKDKSCTVIDKFNSKEIFVGGELITFKSDYYIEVIGKYPMSLEYKDIKSADDIRAC